MRYVQRSILPLLILALAVPLRAADRQAMASLLEKLYKDENMALRTSNSGATVRYSADGHLIKGRKPGPWTLDTNIHCTAIELKGNDLVIKGKRLYFAYDEVLERLRPYIGPPVRVEIDIHGDSPSLSTLQQAIAKVFVTRGDNPVLLVPDYWKDYLLRHTQEVPSPPQQQMSAVPVASMQNLTRESSKQAVPLSSIYGVGVFANPEEKRKLPTPIPTYEPLPPYTPEAKKAGLEGTVILSIVIDASGRVTKESIIRPIGLGLDDNAARTIQTWRFKPSIVDGKPAAVRTLVEASFRVR